MSAPAQPPPNRREGTILKNVTSNWAALVVNIAVSFFLAPFVVASLGSVYYGIWTLLNQFTGYLWLFDFGVRESVIKYVAQYHATGEYDRIDSTVNTSLFLYTPIAILTVLGTSAMAAALPYAFNIPDDAVFEARVTLLLTGGSIAQSFVFNVFVGVLMGLRRFYLVSRMGILFTLLRSGLIVLALKAGYGIIALGLIQFALGTLMGGIVVWHALRFLPTYRVRLLVPQRDELKRVFNYSRFVVGNNIGEKVIFSTDALVIGALQPVSMLTYYAIAGSLIGYLRNLMQASASVLNPETSALAARREDARLGALFATATKSGVLVGLPVCIGLFVLGTRFVSLWVGPQYGPLSGQVLMVLATAHAFGLPHYCISAVLYGLDRHNIIARWRGVEAAVNLALSIVFVYQFGIIGAALGTLCSHVFVAAFVLPRAMAGVIPLNLRDYYVSTYVRPLVAGIPFALACLGVEALAPASLVTFAALGALALPVYALSVWLVALTPAERAAASARVRRLLPAGRRPAPSSEPS